MKQKHHLIMAAALFFAGCTTAVDVEQQVDELYQKMTQEERIAQLRSMYMDDLFNEQGQLDTDQCKKLIPNGIGHFSQFCLQKPREANELRDCVAAIQKWLKENTPNGIPALFHEEVLSGINTVGSTIYPQQIGQACSFNPTLAALKTHQTSTVLRKMGGILALSPMVDVCRIPSFNRLEESYGEDGYLSAVMGTAFVQGLQQGDMTRGVGACSKHYLGYGGGGDASEQELMEEILLPHEAMIRLTGSVAVMPGYHAVHGTKCVANSEILQDILRHYVGFDGMVVSDYTAIDQLPLEDMTTAAAPAVMKAAAAINAGNDVDFPHGANYKHLQEAIDKGWVHPQVLERAVKDVLRIKFRAGLFDKDAYLYSQEAITLDSPEERQTAYDIATQSVVLLQNNGVLPLGGGKWTMKNGKWAMEMSDEDAKSSNEDAKNGDEEEGKKEKGKLNVLLTGPNAHSLWAMCGDYTYPAMSFFWKKMPYTSENPHIVTLLEGMQNSLRTAQTRGLETSLLYTRGCDWTEEIETKYSELGDERAWEYEILHRKVESAETADKQEALQMARKCDVIIAAVGENVMLCGENRDRQGLRLPGKQEQFVEELIQTGKPVVLVMFGGRAQVVSGLAKKCAAVMQAWYPGEEGGNAVADILFGKVAPSAKLSVSYPNTELDEPICYNYACEQDPRIQWPFGYGLSYTTFDYSNLQIAQEVKTSDESFCLSFDIENTGSMAADEIAQVYLSPTLPEQPMKPIQLQGFARVSLQPGERKTVNLKLYTEQLGHYSHETQRQWNIEPGRFIIKIGASSQDIRLQQAINLTGEVVRKPLRDFYFSEVMP